MNVTICSVCDARSPADAAQYPLGPINWLYFVHYPARHPDRVRTGLERLRRDLASDEWDVAS